MCRFSASLAPPAETAEPPAGLDELLAGDDGFDWFNALDELADAELGVAAPMDLPAVAAGAAAPGAALPAQASAECSSAAGSNSDDSTLIQAAAGGAVMASPQQQAAQQPQFAYAALGSDVPGGPFAYAALPGAAGYAVAVPALALQQVHAQVAAQAQAAAFGAPPPPAGLSSPASSSQAEEPGSATPASSTFAPRKPGARGQRSQAEIEAAVERIKQKRRESAQRSRARKNEYIHQLEQENQALRDELGRMQQILLAVQRGQIAVAVAPQALVAAAAPVAATL